MDLTRLSTAAKFQVSDVEAAAYERVSKDDSGIERSPEEQHDDHLETCDEYGWTIGKVYREVGSASKHQRKAREKFDAMIDDLRTGQFTAQVLMLYAVNRGSRKTEEWIELINLCTAAGIVFWVTVYDRIVDPKKPRDRKLLIDDASKGELDVAEMSQVIRRATKASAKKGLPHGRIPYGYRRRYDERTKRLIAQEPHPIESKVVKAMYRRVKRGHTLVSIARHFNEQGIKRRGGGDWLPQNIALMLLRELYMGQRVHDPERKTAYKPLTPNASVTKGTWEPLVTVSTFLAVKRILRDPSRLTNERPGAIVHFLSGIAVCGPCGRVLRVNRRRGQWKYLCVTGGCVTVDKDALDALAHEALLEWLSDPDQYGVLRQQGEAQTAELLAVQDKLARARNDLADLKRRSALDPDEGGVTLDFASSVEPGIRARITKHEVRERELLTPSQLAGLIEPGPDVAKRWKALSFDSKRRVARILLARGPGLVGELRVLRAGPVRGKRQVPVEERVAFRNI